MESLGLVKSWNLPDYSSCMKMSSYLLFFIIQSRKSDAEKRFNPGKGRESQILTLNSATDCLLGKRHKSPICSWRVKISGTSEEGRSECKSSFPTFWVHDMLYNYLSSNFITQTASIWRLNSINMYKDLIQCLPHSRDQYLLVSLSLEQNKQLSHQNWKGQHYTMTGWFLGCQKVCVTLSNVIRENVPYSW